MAMFSPVFRMPKARKDELCEYELERIANINRNLDFLEKLGMLYVAVSFSKYNVNTT